MIAGHTHYPDFANPELLEKIPLSARTVLDVGCAQGALGAAYLRRNPNVRMLGIDNDEEAVAHAAQRLTEAVCGDVEVEPMPFNVPEGIDCIVYGDVLEHLREPWTVLAAHVDYLAPEGTVLICMPNVEHWRFALALLNGTFDYEEQGLFDRTHLRWFTPRTMGKDFDRRRVAACRCGRRGPCRWKRRPVSPTRSRRRCAPSASSRTITSTAPDRCSSSGGPANRRRSGWW